LSSFYVILRTQKGHLGPGKEILGKIFFPLFCLSLGGFGTKGLPLVKLYKAVEGGLEEPILWWVGRMVI